MIKNYTFSNNFNSNRNPENTIPTSLIFLFLHAKMSCRLKFGKSIISY